MGVEPFLIASTIRVIIAQRLVRRLCIECRQAVKPDKILLDHFEKTFKINQNGGIAHFNDLEISAIKDRIGTSATGKDQSDELSTNKETVTRIWQASDKGCDVCNHTGYKGRIGIYEVLTNSTPIQKLIVGNNTSEVIEKAAIDDGMLTMQLDGFVKSLRGLTTIEEVLRVTSSQE